MLLVLATALAVEGMWEPSQLPTLTPALRAAGFDGDAERLASLESAPLGAVVSLGGCTASFVSPDGLLVTNHHCVTGMLQQATREGENLGRDGFYAPTRADERSAGPGASLYIPVETRDVTTEVVGRISPRLDDVARKLVMEDRVKKLVAACERPGGRRCRVSSFYEGLRWSLVVERELKDVRVVMAPPDAVGNYGDEVDNWHWPRHSGDFAFLRAYVAPDGSAAEHAAANVPYRPPRWLPLDRTGASPGEFVMVAGYPGRTNRWQTAWELERAATRDMPARIARREWLVKLVEDRIAEDPAVEVKLQAMRGWINNGLFLEKGALVAFDRTGTVAAAQARDAALRAWVDADPARRARYAPALDELRTRIEARDATVERDLVMAWLGRSDLLSAAQTIQRWSQNRARPDAKRDLGFQDRDREDLVNRMKRMEKGLDLELERRFLRVLLLDAMKLPEAQRVPELAAWIGPGDPEVAVDRALGRLFADPALATVEGRLRWLDADPRTIAASEDGFLSLAVALWPWSERKRAEDRAHDGAMARVRPLYADALRTFDPSRAYPDANGTLRVTFGTVTGYSPRDAVTYAPQTTVEGIVEKAGPWPFDAPAALLDPIRAGKRGPYLDSGLGTVPVDFLTDLDTTGGNSGSPTVNAKGELVGLLFDGNVEGVASDWVFDAPRTRSIHVDIRYVLYYLDAVAGADALLGELGVEPAF